MNNICYGEFTGIDCFSEAFKAKLNVILQVLIFSQSLLYSAAFYLMLPSGGNEMQSAIYGFMFGLLSTVFTVLLQCNNTHCIRVSQSIKIFFNKHSNTFIPLIKMITPVTMLMLYSPSITG